jgi:hypothetical protein
MWEEKFRTISELDEFKVTEERLAKRLGVKEFRLPPDFRDPGQGVTNPSLKIPFVTLSKVALLHSMRAHGESFNLRFTEANLLRNASFGSGRSCSVKFLRGEGSD